MPEIQLQFFQNLSEIATRVMLGFWLCSISGTGIILGKSMLETASAVVAYEFEGFVLDVARGALLTRGGQEVPLRRRSCQLLRLLVMHSGQLRARDAIQDAIWNDIEVCDDSITQCIHRISQRPG